MTDLQKEVSWMCWIYFAFSLLFYIALPLVIFAPFFAPLGLQTPYYIFIMQMVLTDVPAFPGKPLLMSLCFGGTIVIIALFLTLFLIAILKRKFAPFGWLTVISNLITVVVVAMLFVADQGIELLATAYMTLPGIIGNAIFSWRYFHYTNEIKQDVTLIEDGIQIRKSETTAL